MQNVACPEHSFPLSLGTVQRLWVELNRIYFQDRLPPIHIQWSTRLTSTAGLFVSQNGPRHRWISPEERHGKGRIIRLSWPIHQKCALAEIRSTLAHEMIHQWQFDVKKCLPTHGREFRRLMEVMNRDGLGITVYHTLNTGGEELAKYAWRCVLCGRSYTRQRKTVSVTHHRCGECHGTLAQVPSADISGLADRQHSRNSAPVSDISVPIVAPVQLSLQFSD